MQLPQNKQNVEHAQVSHHEKEDSNAAFGSELHSVCQCWREDERDDRHQLDQDVQRWPAGILARVAHCVTDHRGLRGAAICTQRAPSGPTTAQHGPVLSIQINSTSQKPSALTRLPNAVR